MDAKEGIKLIEEKFGSRESFLAYQLAMLSTSGQPCDITFYHQKPILDVIVEQKIGLALMYGAGANKMQEIFRNIKFSNGTAASLGEIWTVNPMPQGGISKEELSLVNLTEAEEQVGPNGETLRTMIKDTYHCTSIEEEDFFLRRFIAS